MPRTRNAPSLPKPRFHYSPIVEAGPWVRFSGMVALDAATGQLQSGGAGAETAKILANLRQAAVECGLSLQDLVFARIFTTRFDHFPEINRAWEEALTDVTPPPGRTSLGVSALPLGATVEIEFDFYKDE